MRLLVLYIFICLLIAGCKKDEYELNYNSFDRMYFNQKLSAYSIYDVEEIIYDDFSNSVDTFYYQLKEHNESVFSDNLGRKAMRIDRYRSDGDTNVWTYLNTWYAVSDSLMVERVEDNKRLIKLSFPITNEAVWNSNALNMDNINNVFYGLRHQKYKLDAFQFDSAVSVESNTIINSFRERAFKEVYAKNIGLVYKYYVYIDKVGNQMRGVRLVYRLKKHVS